MLSPTTFIHIFYFFPSTCENARSHWFLGSLKVGFWRHSISKFCSICKHLKSWARLNIPTVWRITASKLYIHLFWTFSFPSFPSKSATFFNAIVSICDHTQKNIDFEISSTIFFTQIFSTLILFDILSQYDYHIASSLFFLAHLLFLPQFYPHGWRPPSE